MAVTQYIGSRYVPLFSDPIDWDITQEYEPLTIVYYQGNSYTSRQSVPTNIDITNTDYWALTGNYNAQIEQYRNEVTTLATNVSNNTTSISEINSIMPLSAFSSDDTIEDNLNSIRTDFAAADAQIRTDFAAADAQIRTDFAAADAQINANMSHYNDRNPIFYGADPTGVEDSTTAIQNCIDANYNKTVIFTPGKYKITAPIITPYASEDRVSIDFNNSVIIYNGETEIPYMLGIGYKDITSDLISTGSNCYENNVYNSYKNVSIANEGAAVCCIRVAPHYMNTKLNSINCFSLTNGIIVGDTSYSYSSDCLISDSLIWQHPSVDASFVGVDFESHDNEVDNIRVYNYQTMIKSLGMLTGNNIHTLGISERSSNGTSLYLYESSCLITNFYNDNVKTAVYSGGTADICITNAFDYKYDSSLNGRIFLNFYGAANNAHVAINNLRVVTTAEDSTVKYRTLLPPNSGVALSNVHFDNCFLKAGSSDTVEHGDVILSQTPNDCSIYNTTTNAWNYIGSLTCNSYKVIYLMVITNTCFGIFTLSQTTTSVSLNKVFSNVSGTLSIGANVVRNTLTNTNVCICDLYVNASSSNYARIVPLSFCQGGFFANPTPLMADQQTTSTTPTTTLAM